MRRACGRKQKQSLDVPDNAPPAGVSGQSATRDATDVRGGETRETDHVNDAYWNLDSNTDPIGARTSSRRAETGSGLIYVPFDQHRLGGML
jgi:hypothetical protein